MFAAPSVLAVAFSLASAALAADKFVSVGISPAGSPAQLFTPDTITAAVGDNIIFQFRAPTHSVTQATAKLAGPCTSGPGGFDSGISAAGVNYTVPVTTADSVYVFCTPHCSAGMVMIINPGPNDSVATYKGVATGQIQAPPPVTSSSTSTTASLTTSSTESTTSSSTTATTTQPPTTSSTSTTAPSPTTSSPSSAMKKAQTYLAAPMFAAIVLGLMM